jgi:hypothetical protein
MQVPFVKKTVEGVLAGFHKTVNDLRDIAQDRAAEITKCNDEIATLVVKVKAAGAERDKAHNVADKLEQLFSA